MMIVWENIFSLQYDFKSRNTFVLANSIKANTMSKHDYIAMSFVTNLAKPDQLNLLPKVHGTGWCCCYIYCAVIKLNQSRVVYSDATRLQSHELIMLIFKTV